jgi:hypothetical protein
MTFTYKISKRLAIAHRLALVTVAAGILACESKDALSPSDPEPVNSESPKPGDVTDLAVASRRDTMITLSFTEVDDGTGAPAKYDVRWAAGTLSWGSAGSVTAGTCATPVEGIKIGAMRTCTVAGLSPETAYEFRLVAVRGTMQQDAVYGSLSNTVGGTTTAPAPEPELAGRPGTVDDLSVAAVTDTSVTLSFTGVGNGADEPASYDVRYVAGTGGWAWGSAAPVSTGSCAVPFVGTSIGEQETCTVIGLAAATAYEFQVVAFRGTMMVDAVFGGLSNIAGETTAAVPPAPVASIEVVPDALGLTAGDTARLRAVLLAENGDTLVGRAVEWSVATPAGGAASATIATAATAEVVTVDRTGLVTAVAPGSTEIAAVSEGKSASAAVSVSDPVLPDPGNVTDLAVQSVTDSSATLRFTEVSNGLGDPAGYDVRFQTAPLSWGAASPVARGTCTLPVAGSSVGAPKTCTVLGLSPATQYEFQLAPFRGTLKVDAVYGTLSNVASGRTSDAVVPPPPPPPPPGPLSVVPGLRGFGVETPAGRGGQVIKVTNLSDGGSGSLRAALAASGARVIVFEVAGTIRLGSDLRIDAPYVTMAGQTAPSPGITLRSAGIRVNTHDVLIQHIRVRVGDEGGGPTPENRDAIQILGSGARRVVLDHVSVSWAVDENSSSWYPIEDVTVAHSIISEALSRSTHPEGEHSKGLLIGDFSQRFAVIGNLFAHNMDRNPYAKGATRSVIVNNLLYNPGATAMRFSDADGNGPSYGSVVGNVLIKGADTQKDRIISVSNNLAAGSRLYAADNAGSASVWSMSSSLSFDPRVSSPPIWVTGLVARASGTVESWVLANAGARPADRDAVDARVVNQVRTRTGRIINSQSQVGGWPSLGTVTRSLTIPANPNGDADGDGYTNLEEWLHQLAAQVEGR